MNVVNSLRFLVLIVVAVLALFMILSLYLSGKIVALMRFRTLPNSRSEIKSLAMAMAICGAVLVFMVFVIGILLIVNKWRITDPATHIIMAVLFSITTLITALSFGVYFSIKNITQLPVRDVRRMTKTARNMAKTILFTSAIGIWMTFVMFLLLSSESAFYKMRTPVKVSL